MEISQKSLWHGFNMQNICVKGNGYSKKLKALLSGVLWQIWLLMRQKAEKGCSVLWAYICLSWHEKLASDVPPNLQMDPRGRKNLLWRWARRIKKCLLTVQKLLSQNHFAWKCTSFPSPQFSSDLMLPLILLLHATYIWSPLLFSSFILPSSGNKLCKWQDKQLHISFSV